MQFKKKVIAGALAAGLVMGAGGLAAAYWTSAGSGTGSAATGSSAPETLTQTNTITTLHPGGAAQEILGTVSNTKGYTEFIGTITPTVKAVVENTAERTAWGYTTFDVATGTVNHITGTTGTYTCSASDYTLTPYTETANVPSGSATVDFGTIAFNTKPAVNQDACQTAMLILHFSSN